MDVRPDDSRKYGAQIPGTTLRRAYCSQCRGAMRVLKGDLNVLQRHLCTGCGGGSGKIAQLTPRQKRAVKKIKMTGFVEA